MAKSQKHIVLITTWFPPTNGVAVNRMVGFAKYLDKSKFDVTVLTKSETGEKQITDLFDCAVTRIPNHQLLKSPKFNTKDSALKHKLKVVWNIVLLKLKSDIYNNWRKEVVKELNSLNKQKKIDAIISSFSPEAAHLAAHEFCVVHKEIFWVADMRDEMSQNPTISKSVKNKYLKIEKLIDDRANLVTSVSAPICDLFRNTTMHNVADIIEIRNGFDHDLVANKNLPNNIFTIGYAGTFYGEHKPDKFFMAINLLIGRKEFPENFEIHFVGSSKNFTVPGSLKKHVRFIHRVTHNESQLMMPTY